MEWITAWIERFEGSGRASSARRPTDLTAKPSHRMTFLLDYQNVTQQFPPKRKPISISGAAPLSLDRFDGLFEWSCLIPTNRNRQRLTVNSQHQRASGCLRPPPPLLKSERGSFGFMVVMHRYVDGLVVFIKSQPVHTELGRSQGSSAAAKATLIL